MVAWAGRELGVVPAPGLVIGGIVGLQCGAALTTRLFSVVGPAGVVALRLVIAAVVLIAAWRPGLRWDRATWAVVAGTGTLLAVHHLSYYEAIDRLPLGAAATVEFSGPFLIAAIGSRRATDLLWACIAAAGVLLLTHSGSHLSASGLGFAALAGCCWGGYILVAKRLSRLVPDGRGLALAVAWGALLSLPYGLAQAGARLFQPPLPWAPPWRSSQPSCPTPSSSRRCGGYLGGSSACSPASSPPSAHWRASSCWASVSPCSSGSASPPSPWPPPAPPAAPASRKQGPALMRPRHPIREAALVRNHPPDLINVAMERIIEASLELPAYSALDDMAATIRTVVNEAIFAGIVARMGTEGRQRAQGLLKTSGWVLPDV